MNNFPIFQSLHTVRIPISGRSSSSSSKISANKQNDFQFFSFFTLGSVCNPKKKPEKNFAFYVREIDLMPWLLTVVDIWPGRPVSTFRAPLSPPHSDTALFSIPFLYSIIMLLLAMLLLPLMAPILTAVGLRRAWKYNTHRLNSAIYRDVVSRLLKFPTQELSVSQQAKNYILQETIKIISLLWYNI